MRWLLIALVVLNVAFVGWRVQADRAPPEVPGPPATRSAHVNRLLLLSEIDSDELRTRAPAPPPADAPRSPAAAPDSAPVPEASLCLSIGPVREDDVEPMGTWLVDRGATAQLRPDERRELAQYWIFFPPFASRSAAQAQVDEMKALGIDDISVIRRGDMANAVSLGVYSRKASLDRRMSQLEDKGYEPRVSVRHRQKKATWYDARFARAPDFEGEGFASRFPLAQVREIGCAEVEAKLKPSGLPRSIRPGTESAPESGPSRG